MNLTRTAPTYTSSVTVYGSFPMRNLSPAEALDFIDSRPAADVTCILGRMRPGYLGREAITRDDLDRWVAEDMTASEWADVAAGEQFDRDVQRS